MLLENSKSSIVLVTGIAGFIGFHVAQSLLIQGHRVIGIDNLNDYYDVDLKIARLAQLGLPPNEVTLKGKEVKGDTYGARLMFFRIDLEDRLALEQLFKTYSIDIVCNLAAQAGVRYSLENPAAYVDSNVVGFVNILECCRHHEVRRLVYASSSSVYGNSDEVPFKESARVDHPISLYAATKKSNELMAYTYSHLFGIETIGLRFFTVYGPWGRPDMAMFLFTKAILNHQPIKVFNHGDLSRDFTYIDDIVKGVIATLLEERQGALKARIYNIGNSQPVRLLEYIEAIEQVVGIEAKKEMLPMQPGDVRQTYADVTSLEKDYNYRPSTSVQSGIGAFVAWYRNFYQK